MRSSPLPPEPAKATVPVEEAEADEPGEPEAEARDEKAASSAGSLAFDADRRAAELAAATRDKTDYSLAGLDTDVKVVDVYDGDTIRVKFHLDGRMVQYMARMAGYDSPEMNGGAAEKAAALNARNALAARLHGRCVVPPKRKKAVFIGGRVVRAVFGKFDKYGRPLITLYADGDDLNQWMISRGHGYPYSGGTKKKYGAA